MEIYLVIITTILVITQIIRLIQNYMQLKHIKYTENENKEVKENWYKMLNELENLNKNLLKWRDKN